MEIQNYLEQCKQLINAALEIALPPASTKLHNAVRYSSLNGGKRLRGALVYATGEALNVEKSVLTEVALAIEMIHAFSLIHDDLPALDNDDLRRGKPTCHIVFSEATAILAGDVLQSLAFETLAKIDDTLVNSDMKVKMVSTLAQAIGSYGMIGGEELDLEMVNKTIPVQEIEEMYRLKTGCLISASVVLPVFAANCRDKSILDNLKKFGENIGISFQIHDDIIGIESDTKTLGKKQHADLDLNKPVYPVLVGMENAKKRRDELFDIALGYLAAANINAKKLKDIASYMIQRIY